MKEERKGEGRPPAKALEVTSGPAFSSERASDSQACCLASGASCPDELRFPELCPTGGGPGIRESVPGHFTSIAETGRANGRFRRKDFSSLIDL